MVYDNLSRGRTEWLEDSDIRIEQGDILDVDRLKNCLTGIDTVVHLAAFGSVVESVVDPVPNFENNVIGTLNVLSAARQQDIGKLVFASTGGALIGDAQPPVSEASLPRPISPYGASKLCGEAYCHAFGKAYGIETVALRFANVFGPQSAHKKGAITEFIKAIMSGRPMVIYGDGRASRDFLYVLDLCAGILDALDTTVPPGSVLHLASGRETRILELARAIAKIAGAPDHPIEHRPKRPGEVGRNFASFDLARATIGFEPKWSLTDGLATTWHWFQAHYEPEAVTSPKLDTPVIG